jgi:glycosyltransferase involved in cell wall biosynthesis
MTYYLIIVFAVYFLMILALLSGWFKVIRPKNNLSDRYHFLSIVVAARNEERNIGKLLNSISKLSYPHDFFEVIIVDDHSKDNTRHAVAEFLKSNQPVNTLLLFSENPGKKEALALGIRSAKGEIIITTDADCLVPSNWLQRINQQFSRNKTQLCIGSVKIEPHNFFSRLQSMEFSSVVGTGAATLGLGFPTMCNGANLSFRKETFEMVNGYDGNKELPSGDDQFLMQKIHNMFSDSVSFLNFSDAVVSTQHLKSLSGFIDQRIRWAGKSGALPFHSQLLAVFIFLFQVTWLFATIVCVIHPSSVVISLIIAKVFVEFLFLYNINRFLSRSFDYYSFLVLQFLYAPYVIWISLISRVKGFVWKERKY